MRIQLLRTFLVCAELRSFSLAAQRLLYAESSIAYHIRDLEKALGARLFARRDGRLDLTPAGQAILQPAVRLLRTADEMTRLIQECSPGAAQRRRVQPPLRVAGTTEVPVPRRRLPQESGRSAPQGPLTAHEGRR